MTNWYYMIDKNRLGPFSSKQLKEMAESGQLQGTDKVGNDQNTSWVAAAKVKGLISEKPQAKSPPTIPPNKTTSIKSKRPVWIACAAGTGVLCLVLLGWWKFGSDSKIAEPTIETSDSTTSNSDALQASNDAPRKFREPETEPIKVEIPDFSQVDYSVPFNENDYKYDFSDLDYTKGPNGQPLQTTIEYKLYDGTATLERPTDSGRIENRRVLSFYMENGNPVKHGVEAVYTMDQRAIMANENLPNGGKGADSDYARWKYDSDKDLADGFIKLEYADKISETHWYKGEMHGPVRMWFPSRKLGINERNTKEAKQTLNRRLPGPLKLQSQSVHGKAHGVSIVWAIGKEDPMNNFIKPVYKQGEIWRLNGVLHGPQKEWLEDGSVWVGTWKEGKMHGFWDWSVSLDNKMKLPDDTEVKYNGVLPYYEGHWHGVEKTWFDVDHKLLMGERTYEHGVLLLSIGYHPNGQISRKVIFRDGKQVSKFEWKEDGTPITVTGQGTPNTSSSGQSPYDVGYSNGVATANGWVQKLRAMGSVAQKEFVGVYRNELRGFERNRDQLIQAYGLNSEQAQQYSGLCQGIRDTMQKAGFNL